MTAIKNLELARLLDQLDNLHLEKIEHISFADLEWILSDFAISWGQRLPVGPADQLPESDRVYHQIFGTIYLPFSTVADFPAVSPNQVRILALAATCLTLYLLLLDDIIDEPETSPTRAKIALQPVLLHFYRCLHQLFPPQSTFWLQANNLLNLTAQSILDEHECYSDKVVPFSLAEFKRIAHGKMAFVQMNSLALTILNGTPHHVPTLSRCWQAASLGAIVRDDILDWRRDYEKRNYTYLLSQVLLSEPFRADVMAGNLPRSAEVGAALFCTDLIESLYGLALTEMQAAVTGAMSISCPALASLLCGFEGRMRRHAREFVNRKLAAHMAMVSGSI